MHRRDLRIRFQKLFSEIKIRFILRSYKTSARPFKRLRNRLLPGVGYLLPILIAAAVTVTLFLSFPPSVSSSMSVPVQEPQPGVIVSYEDIEFGWVDSKQAFYLLKQRFPPERQWVFTNSLVKRKLVFTASSVRRPDREIENTAAELNEFLDSYIPGYCIAVQEEPLVVLEAQEDCEFIIKRLIQDFTPEANGEEERITDLSVKIAEHPRILRGIFKKTELLSPEDALRYLKKGTMEEKIYTVVPKDTIWSIAQNYGLTMDEIVRANPEIRPDYIYPGDTISLIVPKPFLTVHTEYTREFTRRIQYRTIVKADPALYRTEAITERRGSFGKERITAKITMKNGLMTDRETVSSEILVQPVSAVVRMGTARTPEDILVASAVLPPGIGVITSHFGPRWGRFHYGIDVSSPLGTPVHAYKSGTVAFTGYDPILGNMVAISHGSHLVTRYGHAQSILVSTGQRVAEGEVIALSGNTGYSTGPHVHFEIRKKGVAMDPLQYLLNLQQQENSQ